MRVKKILFSLIGQSLHCQQAINEICSAIQYQLYIIFIARMKYQQYQSYEQASDRVSLLFCFIFFLNTGM